MDSGMVSCAFCYSPSFPCKEMCTCHDILILSDKWCFQGAFGHFMHNMGFNTHSSTVYSNYKIYFLSRCPIKHVRTDSILIVNYGTLYILKESM